MRNRFIDPRIEMLSESVNDVFLAKKQECEKKEDILDILAKWMEEGLDIFVKTTEEEAMEDRHWDVQVMKDKSGKSSKSITVFTSDEVPFEMCMNGNIILYFVIPVWIVLKAVGSGMVDQMELISREGDICLSQKDIADYFWKREKAFYEMEDVLRDDLE